MPALEKSMDTGIGSAKAELVNAFTSVHFLFGGPSERWQLQGSSPKCILVAA